MEILWIVALLMGLGMTLKAWNAHDYALRVMSRTFGPLLVLTGFIGFFTAPMKWKLAILLFGCVLIGGLVTWLTMRVLKVKK